MIDSPEKLSNDHTHDAQSLCLANPIVELTEHGLQPRTVGQLEGLTGKLVKSFAQGSSMQSAISPASTILQSTDEMKMAELNNPALGCTQFYNSGNLVGDRGSDPFVYRMGNGREGVSPTLHVLSAWLQHRIEEDRSILMTRLESHHIQDPIFSSKSEVESIQDQNQRSSCQSQTPRPRCELSQNSTKSPTQPLRSKIVAWSESFQCVSVHQHCLQNPRTHSLRFASTPFLADSPSSLALTALTSSRTEVINFGSATLRFRVPQMHAREVHTVSRVKYLKTRRNSV
jgi:hypothetical protein